MTDTVYIGGRRQSRRLLREVTPVIRLMSYMVGMGTDSSSRWVILKLMLSDINKINKRNIGISQVLWNTSEPRLGPKF